MIPIVTNESCAFCGSKGDEVNCIDCKKPIRHEKNKSVNHHLCHKCDQVRRVRIVKVGDKVIYYGLEA